MRADLHIHTTASDGLLSPAQIVRQAVELELDVIAITDHDTVAGVEPALVEARRFAELTVIPGVELNTDVPQGEVHILGYFIDHEDRELQVALESLRNARKERARQMVARLSRLGIHIDWERVLELAGTASVGRPHIARAVMERGYVSSVNQAFARYIGRHGPAYVERKRLTPVAAVQLVLQAGGLPAFAHPADAPNLGVLIPQLKQAGLVGLESYYNGYSQEVIAKLNAMAQEYDLIPCGGSDYHGGAGSTGAGLGSVELPAEAVAELIVQAGHHRRSSPRQ